MDDFVAYPEHARSGRLLGWAFVFFVGLASSVLRAEESSFWSPPLSEMPAEAAARSLVMILITNDVAEHWRAKPPPARPKPQSCWCQRPLARAISRVPSSFSQPSAPIHWQHWPLGLPSILTGGREDSGTGRTMVLVTDGNYRLLGLFVGVPENDELMRLIQDAEDVRTLLNQSPEDPDRLVELVAEHCRERLPRLWRIEMDQQLKALGETPEDRVVNVLEENDSFTEQVRLRFRLVTEQVQNAYLKDVQLRFGLTRSDDFERLTVLEQHSATRRSWSGCVLPFLVGVDVRVLYHDLAEMVWDRHAMPVRPDDGDSLAAWISSRQEDHPFALQVPLPGMQGRSDTSRIVVSETARRHGLGWDDLDQMVNQNPIRKTRLDELAAWLLQNNARPIDLQRPTHTRYLFFRSPSDRAFPIRDGDPPGPSITMIRQVQK